jgi:hypothetical protein
MKKVLIYILLALFIQRAKAQDTTRLTLMFLGDIMQHATRFSNF